MNAFLEYLTFFILLELTMFLPYAGAGNTGYPWHDQNWPIVEQGEGYTRYEVPADTGAYKKGEVRTVISGFGNRSTMGAKGHKSYGTDSWYETYHYLIDPYGKRYNERLIERTK